jgi:hypothetical protein
MKTKKSIGFVVFCFLVITGTYNAIVINEDSTISSGNIAFVKRLDEIYGVVTPGRMVAASTTWKKLNPAEIKADPIIQTVSRLSAAPVISESKSEDQTSGSPEAAVREELNLTMSEVTNPKKWPNGLVNSDYSGNLVTNNGVIESLSVSLPNSEGISVSFSEMAGNVFEYELDGEILSGMMYQVDQNSYMITLSNGPLEGTRMRFVQSESDTSSSVQENEESLSVQDAQVDVGNNGEEQIPSEQISTLNDYDQQIQAEALAAQSANLET